EGRPAPPWGRAHEDIMRPPRGQGKARPLPPPPCTARAAPPARHLRLIKEDRYFPSERRRVMAQQLNAGRHQAMSGQDRKGANRHMGPMTEKGTPKAPHGLRHQEHEFKKGDTGGCCRGY